MRVPFGNFIHTPSTCTLTISTGGGAAGADAVAAVSLMGENGRQSPGFTDYVGIANHRQAPFVKNFTSEEVKREVEVFEQFCEDSLHLFKEIIHKLIRL